METLVDAMKSSVTAGVSKSIRSTADVKEGDYIGFRGKDILASGAWRPDVVLETVSSLDFDDYDIALIIFGKTIDESEAEMIVKKIGEKYRGKEAYLVDGKQEIYDYIIILE